MNVFHKFTRKSLAQNRTRTVVTLIGIVLSMALFTAVTVGAYSGVRYLQNCEIDLDGAWHGYCSDMTGEAARDFALRPGVTEAAEFSRVGWAEIGSENENKPYLLIKSAGENIGDLLSIRLVSGRMPENSGEILLPEHLSANGNVFYETGDTLTLNVGTRMSGSEVLPEDSAFYPDSPEEIAGTLERTYTVTGTYERLDYTIEPYSCPGYTAITRDTPCESVTLFFTLKNPAKYNAFAAACAGEADLHGHTDLLRLYGSVRNGNITNLIYGFAGILCFLIAFGSVSLIYNSFSISVGERTKQFGILKSVGATKKQLRSGVLYEALLLDAAAVPVGLAVGCAGIGITLYCLRDAFASLSSGVSTQMRFAASPGVLAIAAAVCVATTLVSAWIPAKRAMKVSAIDAIRQTADVKIRGKEVKTSRLTQKLFGFEGMMAAKNFKRNKKRYRSTIVSLFLSITLFVSASSFCAYLKDSVNGVMSTGTAADICYEMFPAEDSPAPEEVHALLQTASGVTGGFYANETSDGFVIDTVLLDESYLRVYSETREVSDGPVEQYCMVWFLTDEDFAALCKENRIDPADFLDPDAPQGLIYNSTVSGRASRNGDMKWYSHSLLDEAKLPCTLYTDSIRYPEGYIYDECRETEDGTEYVFYPESYLDRYWETHDDPGELDPEKAMVLPEEEAVEKRSYCVSAAVEKLPFGIETDQFALIYPMRVQQSVAGDDGYIRSVFAYRSSSHAQTCAEMKKLLSDSRLDTGMLVDIAEQAESSRMLITVINIFSYGFIILISLIAAANVVNTISTSISLRRREFAMLKSIGMSEKGFSRMMNYECMIYGLKSLLWGLPASVAMTYLIYTVTGTAFDMKFYVPWYSIAIAVFSVFAVVFAAMLYATGKIKKDNPIDALKNENL